MKLYFFRGKTPNFGDELNPYLWPRLLPEGFLDDDASEIFLGIGSILNDALPKAGRKVVFGSGHAGYRPPPALDDGLWDVVFVRGPRTAARLGLDPGKAICDGAVLLRTLTDVPAPAPSGGIAFMPHYESMERGHWTAACRLAGIELIDPRQPIDTVIASVRGARALITEAMHGAIVADTFRTPWIAVQPINPVHRIKWLDWADSLDIPLRGHALKPSSAMELYVGLSRGRGEVDGRAGRLSRTPLAAPIDAMLTRAAARCLSALADEEPQLSPDRKLEEATERAVGAIERFVKTRDAAGDHSPA